MLGRPKTLEGEHKFVTYFLSAESHKRLRAAAKRFEIKPATALRKVIASAAKRGLDTYGKAAIGCQEKLHPMGALLPADLPPIINKAAARHGVPATRLVNQIFMKLPPVDE